jgi:purine-binding chemotaxis protein CheW
MSDTRQLATFWADGLLFGVDVTRVQEVIRFQAMTTVPLANEVVHGLINLRGQIVTALDLRTRLALAPRPGGERPMNVIIRTEDGAVSLLVDEIGDVLEVPQDSWEAAPATLKGVARELITGAFKLKECLLLVLDADKTTDVTAVAV